MRRLLLVTNANARWVTGYRREVIARALSAEFAVEVAETEGPGHAIGLAREAASGGVDLVVALGGDGTVNEVANGLAGTATPMAILPAGGVNVFARSLGLPEDPVEATGLLLHRVGAPARRISLGRAEDRFFTVSCGVGFDAAIVRHVERRQGMKRTAGDWFFVWSGLRVFFLGYRRRRPRVHLAWGADLEHRRGGLHLAIIQNTGPYTYWGRRGLRLCPHASLDRGLDCFAMDSMGTARVLRVVLRAFGSGGHVRDRHVLYLEDQARVVVECDEPMPVQADGEFLGERQRLAVESVPAALSVLC